MRGLATWTSALAGALLLAGPAAAQAGGKIDPDLRDRILTAYDEIDPSIVSIRTTAHLEREYKDPETGHVATLERPLTAMGSGVVVGRAEVDGVWEYLIMTNHHVADVSNYVIIEGPFMRENRHNTLAVPSVPEESFLITGDDDADVELIEVVRDVRGDFAVFRTIGVHLPLTKFPDRIGYEPGTLEPGMMVITSGYPNSGGKVTQIGHIRETARLHELGLPHHDIILDFSVKHGQSGSPVFLVDVGEGAEPEIRFTLIGLLHANENDEAHVVPWELWMDSFLPEAGTAAERAVR